MRDNEETRRLSEAGVNIRSSVGRPPLVERKLSIRTSKNTYDKSNGSELVEPASQFSGFIPILPKPTAFPFVITVPHILPVEERPREKVANLPIATAHSPRPTLEERCREICIPLPDLSKVKELPIEKTKCIVVHCGHSQERNPDLYFFPFPNDTTRCAMWIINCDRLDLFKKDLLTLTTQCIICEDHFPVSQCYVQTQLFEDNVLGRKNCFNHYNKTPSLPSDSITSEIPAKKKRLISGAVPTLFNTPTRPPKRNTEMPELQESSGVSVQEQCDDLQVILLPPSPPEQVNGTMDIYINGDIEMDEDSNSHRNDSPEKDLICEVSSCSEQKYESDFCEIVTPVDVLPINSNSRDFSSQNSKIATKNSVPLSEENLAAAKRQRLNNCFSDKYIVTFDISEAIQSLLRKKGQPKYLSMIADICDMKTFAENSFQDIKGAVENTFSAVEEDIKCLKSELQARKEEEVINISDDEEEQPSTKRTAVSSLPKQGSLPRDHLYSFSGSPLPRFNKTVLPQHSSVQNMVQKNRNLVNSVSSSDSTDVIQIAQISIARPNLPCIGPVVRWDVVAGMQVIASKLSFLHSWCRAVVLDVLNGTKGEKLYRIRFEGRKNGGSLCTGKQLAYPDNPKVILPVGSRVVAIFKSGGKENEYHAGIVAEPPKIMNSYRYLLFFDSGHAQYVTHKEIHLVCEASKEVWEDIHQESKEFIKSYLKEYPERPMVKLQKGQTVSTELNEKWLLASVKEVDASLVKLEFENKQTEWIYRGSTRLAPLYKELANAQANQLSGKFRRHHVIGKRPHQPYVEYTRGTDEPVTRPIENTSVTVHTNEKQPSDVTRPQVAKKHTGGPLQSPPSDTSKVAKKPTSYDRILFDFSNDELDSTVLPSEHGQRHTRTIENREHYKYHRHTCSMSCHNILEESLPNYKGENPLRIPTLCGWERQVVKQRTSSKRVVFYRAPCSRRLRNVEEVNKYLICTQSKLTIDLFCFDSDVHTFSEFVPSKILFSIPDISYGKENIPVPCVNSLYNEEPIYVPYSTVRFPANGVHLNLDPEFLCGCDCEDNCQDASKCSCQQLTINATEALPGGKVPDAGYKYRRLMEPLITGIYECNVRCKCKSSCMNRVVQNGLQVRLQLFRTERKGWGIRCIDDIPQGMFICIYAGQLLTEQGANEDGHQYGDEYLAELDHIEVVERLKEGYESDVVEPENESENSDSDDDSSSEASSSSSEQQRRKSKYESDSDFELDGNQTIERAPHSFRLRTRKIADDNSSGNSHPSDQPEDAYLLPPKLARQTSNSSDEKDINPSDGGVCNPPVLSPNLPEVKKVKVPWPSALSSDKNTDGDSSNEDSNINDEEPQVRKSLFGNLPDPKNLASQEEKNEKVSVRKYFNEEYCYIMDAKNCGNIGRYLNHSCDPNVFVQNVFVDSHDLRFPWVAFFAMVYIRAGSELTWDYSYDVGSVPGKVMYCYCASSDCRGRLL